MSEKSPLTADELLELRERLDEIDTGIVDLIAERQAVVTAIGDHKLRTGAPLRHYAREREVIDRGMARAESHGLSGAVARDVLETLIHHSLGNQETHKLVQSDHGAGKRALVDRRPGPHGPVDVPISGHGGLPCCGSRYRR